MSDTPAPSWLEAAWAQREDQVYAALFGNLGPGIYPLNMALFEHTFGQTEIDPRWLTHGVFESPPNTTRDSWLYVTSGLSNAWEDDQPEPDGWSGLGQELLLETREQSPWALRLLRNFCAYQLLLAAGRFGEQAPLGHWDRMRTQQPIDGADSQLQALLFIPAPGFAGAQQLLSGRFEFVQLLGLTLAEHAWGQAAGYEALQERLAQAAASPVIDPGRASVL
ncbi:suppressor of fused domain protein [Pseudomonas sp. Fl5BN2]|uniref:suppressor of fused domain protein n=1 Tax=Pseudomonas sp. Fl5BN2 TaxID=2697652 RepID=UPI0013783B5C|nr:suppressor of fused domain protein [Pseudomonas sp. Fl5BN2]NBF05992.1 suppressor of fused domain protein [Pseudomonas sp. Fl5BN2]